MSFAWASAASTVTSMVCYLILWRDRSIFRPSFRQWGSVLNFGIYDSATAVISQVADSLPYFIFGKLFTPAAVGLAQRAVMLCMMPERVILAGVSAVALPAFAKEAREGRSVRASYLRAIELVTAAQWPSLILLALLAHGLVAMLLGSQWLAAAPLMQIVAVALMFAFPIVLHYAMVVSVGALRYMPLIMIAQGICSIGALTLAARHGLHAAALSTLVILPCNGLLAVGIARHFLEFRWGDLFAATRKSLAVTVLCAAGPALILLVRGGPDLGLGITVLALAIGGLGWLAGLRVTRHPLLAEISRFVGAVRIRLRLPMWRQANP
jgi:O-antigen/teichoic acid export membrane protein